MLVDALSDERISRRERWNDPGISPAQVVRLAVQELKSNPCVDCGLKYPPHVMDFDHLDPTIKIGDVSRLAHRRPLAIVLAEIAKCDLVCANCHRERTHQRQSA